MRIKMILLICLLSNIKLYSQIDSSKSNYFPHHLGDIWVYYVHNGVGDDTLQITVISDSVDAEGSVHVRYNLSTRKPNDPPTVYWCEYQKIDTGGNVYMGDGIVYSQLQYRANAQLGERWATGYDIDTAFVYKVFNDSILGIATTIRQIGHRVGTEGYAEGYADGFGIVFRTGSYAIAGELYLLAAKINGIKYGDTKLTLVQNDGHESIPTVFRLFQNYPNPFNGGTVIRYILSEKGMVKLSVYDILGREVRKLVDAHQEQGQYSVSFEPVNLASGIYFYKLETKRMFRIGKMVLQK